MSMSVGGAQGAGATADRRAHGFAGSKRSVAAESKRLMSRWLLPVCTVLLVAAVVVPVGYMLLLSITPNNSVALGIVSFAHLAFSNYVAMWSVAPLASGLLHTLIIAASAAAISVALGMLAAYPLTRLRFRGRGPYLVTLIGVHTIPGTTLLLPLFAIMSWIQTSISIHLIGSYWLVIVTYMSFGVPLSTWLLFSYLTTVPPSLEEAALVDGCTRFGALRRIILPIAFPAVAVAFVFAFLVGWNDVLFASVFTNSSTQTLAIALQRFSASQDSSSLPLYGELMSAAVVSAAPVVVLYLTFQRYLVSGLSAGSLTGV